MGQILACVFDLDGTLADTIEDLAFAVNRSLKMHGLAMQPVPSFYGFLGNGSKVLIHKASLGKLSPEEEKAVFDDYLDYYEQHYAEKTRPFQGLVEVLTVLKKQGMELACLTNKPEAVAQDLVEKLFPGLFDAVVGNSVSFPPKPDPSGLMYLLGRLGIKGENAAYFGDSDVDMQLAFNAKLGFKVGVGYGYRPLKELLDENPDAMIYAPKEILSLPFVSQSKEY